MAHAPTSPLVAVAWLRSLVDLPAGVATSRPTDASSWASNGFIVVSIVGSAGIRDLAYQRKPIVSVDAWAVSLNSSKPPRNQAAGLLEIIRASTEDFQPVTVNVGTGYDQALVTDAWVESAEPREIPDPDSSYAHFTMDLGLAWVRIS